MGSDSVSQSGWHLSRGGQTHGPLSDKEFRLLVENRKIKSDDLIWRPGFDDWKPAGTVFSGLGPPPISDSASTYAGPRLEIGHRCSRRHDRARRPLCRFALLHSVAAQACRRKQGHFGARKSCRLATGQGTVQIRIFGRRLYRHFRQGWLCRSRHCTRRGDGRSNDRIFCPTSFDYPRVGQQSQVRRKHKEFRCAERLFRRTNDVQIGHRRAARKVRRRPYQSGVDIRISGPRLARYARRSSVGPIRRSDERTGFLRAIKFHYASKADLVSSCKVEHWKYSEFGDSNLKIEGTTSCASGTIHIQAFDGKGNYLGNGIDMISSEFF